jgi:hypothetical protein
MQFLKKNYEKILLAVVVLAALGVVACLPILVSQEKQKLDELEQSYLPKHPKPLPPLDLKPQEALLARVQTKAFLDVSETNETDKLFNPVRWQKDNNGRVFPNPAGGEVRRLEVVKLSPLYFDVSLETVSVSPGLPTHYAIQLQHEAGLSLRDRARKTIYAPLNVTTNGFTIVSAEGPEEDPTNVDVQLSEPDKTISIARGRPFKWPEGYTVDLRYPPENRTFANHRIGDIIYFAGESYKIIDIKDSEVVLSQESNQKIWIKKFSLTNAGSTAPPP